MEPKTLPIPGFPKYFATSNGQILSTWKRNPRKLRPALSQFGYLMVALTKDNKHTTRFVHHLVLETFSRKKLKWEVTRHLDGTKTNNDITNLCWGTREENEADKIKHGKSNRGHRNGMSKLKPNEVKAIKTLLTTAISKKQIAKYFSISYATIIDINSKRRWDHA